MKAWFFKTSSSGLVPYHLPCSRRLDSTVCKQSLREIILRNEVTIYYKYFGDKLDEKLSFGAGGCNASPNAFLNGTTSVFSQLSQA